MKDMMNALVGLFTEDPVNFSQNNLWEIKHTWVFTWDNHLVMDTMINNELELVDNPDTGDEDTGDEDTKVEYIGELIE